MNEDVRFVIVLDDGTEVKTTPDEDSFWNPQTSNGWIFDPKARIYYPLHRVEEVRVERTGGEADAAWDEWSEEMDREIEEWSERERRGGSVDGWEH